MVWKLSEPLCDQGQTVTITLMSIAASSLTMALGSGHSSASKLQSPCTFQCSQSMTITSTGTLRLWKPRAASSSADCEL